MWTVTVALDPTKDDIGLVRAVWNQGQPDEVVYQGRHKIATASRAVIVAEANAQKDSELATASRAAQLASIIEGDLNG